MYRDGRRYNDPQWYLTPPRDWRMRVPSQILKCVVFLGQRDPDDPEKKKYTDTGFIVGVPSKVDPKHAHLYLVTSAHSAKGLPEADFLARMNRMGEGPSEDIQSGEGFRWYYHPDDEGVDAAVHPITVPAGFEVSVIPRSMFWTGEKPEEGDFIGLGDETFVAGLFPEFVGTQRSSPLLHFGNLIGLPSEKIAIEIEDKKKVLADAFLIEVRSIKGLSGSPVFLNKPILVDNPDQNLRFYASGQFCFLGLMHGHWKYPLGDLTRLFPAVEDGLHSGVAVVVPARKIVEVLDQPKLVQMRKEMDENLRKKQLDDAITPSRDSANQPKTQKTRAGVEIGIPTKSQILGDLKKASRRREK